MFDTLILGGTVVDGTGAAPRRADVALQNGKIAAVGDLAAARAAEVIDARGKCVTPGFIDIHRHGDTAVFRPDFGLLELRQGLTTIINGNCGLSAAPSRGPYQSDIIHYMIPINGAPEPDIPMDTMREYLDAVAQRPLPLHVGTQVGGGTVRARLTGYVTEKLTAEEIREIRAELERSLAEGALGVSLGMGYAPECFYSTSELIEVLRPLQGTDILVTCHMRQEGSEVEKSVAEMIEVARALGIRLQISHLKAIGKVNWGAKIPQVLQMLRQAREEGVRITCDVYPYTAGSTQLSHILPPEFLRGGVAELPHTLMDPHQRPLIRRRMETGTDFENISLLVGWDNIVMASLALPHNAPYRDLPISQIAQMQGKDPFDCLFDMLAEERGEITMIDFVAAEEDIALLLQDSESCVISDSTYPTGSHLHPRLFGTFVRVLERYVKERQILTLPQAIHKMTGLPAQRFGLTGKGVVAEGMDADLCIFDPETIHETGTYENPASYPTGLDYVLVAGKTTIRNDQYTGETAGRLLRR